MDSIEMLSPTESGIQKYFATLSMPDKKKSQLYFIPDNTVELLINGPDYFDDFHARLNTLGAHDFVYISGWWFAPDYTIGGESFADKLKDLAGNGVDVRVMAWSSQFLMNNPKFLSLIEELQGLRDGILNNSADFIRDLRSVDELEDKAILTTIAHPLGGHHAKFVVIGSNGIPDTAYIGGCDFTHGREISPQDTIHGFRGWHDATVKLEGTGTKAVFNIYARLWEEQRNRSIIDLTVDDHTMQSHTANMPALNLIDLSASEMRTFPNVHGSVSDACIQVLPTIPNMTAGLSMASFLTVFSKPFLEGIGVFEKKNISFAKQGLFNFKEAIQHAISAAEKYIFIMDQAFTSFDVMDWINLRLHQNPGLKVILINGADPADPASDNLNEAVYNHLLVDLPAHGASPCIRDNIVFCEWPGVAVHGKVTIIDDKWCAIGSANSMRRSLYTDTELSIGIFDRTQVKAMRNKLWAYYSSLNTNGLAANIMNSNEDLELALGLWKDTWMTADDDSDLLDLDDSINVIDLEEPRGEVEFSSIKYDFMDPDSRYL